MQIVWLGAVLSAYLIVSSLDNNIVYSCDDGDPGLAQLSCREY